MEKFELTVSPKYVPNWGKWEALREIMQNVIDRENEKEEAVKIVKYYPDKNRLIIGNKFSSLKKNTLLLGETTKAKNVLLPLSREWCKRKIETEMPF